MSKYLPVHEVAELAVQVASAIRLRTPSEEELCLSLMKRHKPPQLIFDGYAQLWVDKLFIAFSNIDDQVVHYVYITDRHIAEEYQSYQAARMKRKNEGRLPEPINKQFRDALRKMSCNEKNYVIYKTV